MNIHNSKSIELYKDMQQCITPGCKCMIDKNYIEDTKRNTGMDVSKCMTCRGVR